MRTVTIALGLLLFVAATASAGIVDFEDMTLGDQVTVPGGPVVTDGVTLTGQTFYWLPSGSTDTGYAEVQADGDAGGSGNELWFNNLNVDFDFGSSVIQIVLNFGEYGGNCNLEINGTLENFQNFDEIDGMTIAGVQVTATGPGATGQGTGQLTLDGTINDFAIGGQEFAVDTVDYIVPEPAAMSLLLLGGLLCTHRLR